MQPPPPCTGYEAGGENDIFRQYSKKFAVLRPVTPGYPFIATEFTKTAQDILNGADPKKALDQAVKDIDANQKAQRLLQVRPSADPVCRGRVPARGIPTCTTRLTTAA